MKKVADPFGSNKADPAEDKRQQEKVWGLGDFARKEFTSAISDIRSALIDEGWFDRTSASVTHMQGQSLGWELPEDRRGDRNAEDPFGRRLSASDPARQRAEPDHPRELDFDR